MFACASAEKILPAVPRVDFREILKAQTYDAKVNHNLNLTGIPESVKITPEPIKKAPETVDTTEKTAPEPTE